MEQNDFIHSNEYKKETINHVQERCYYKLKWKDENKNVNKQIEAPQIKWEDENKNVNKQIKDPQIKIINDT